MKAIRKQRWRYLSFLVGFSFVAGGNSASSATAGRKLFTVADDIEIARFDNAGPGPVAFSPDGRYFAVVIERGRLDVNRPEALLRVYRTQDVVTFLSDQKTTNEPQPFWTVRESTYKDGPLITDLRWLPDSREMAFLLKAASGNERLYIADVKARNVEPLTAVNQNVTAFDIQSRSRFVYAILSPKIRDGAIREMHAGVTVGTGRDFESLMYPEILKSTNIWTHDLSELWAVRSGKRFRIFDASTRRILPVHLEGERALSLSPDGRFAMTAVTVPSVPESWESLYPPPSQSSAYRITKRIQDPLGLAGQRDVSEYVLVELATGKIIPLTMAPIGNAAAWWGVAHTEWSLDGKSVLLSNTFVSLPGDNTGEPNKSPCIAIVELPSRRIRCVVHFGTDWEAIDSVAFVKGNSKVVTVRYLSADGRYHTRTFAEFPDETWKPIANLPESRADARPIEVFVREDLNSSPVLMARINNRQSSRIIWDPNPQLKNVRLGTVSVFKWTDKKGREWVGGLYKPPDFILGEKYPLIIQTHGFDAKQFSPSGAFTTAFAAQELASAGFLVLQVEDCPIRGTPDEGPCQVAGYEAAVARLSSEGLIDASRVGIIGFSRTCYYVLEALTTSDVHFTAASVTDGVDEGYLQYMLDIDGDSSDSIAREAEEIIGARPFGEGLLQWFKRSPEFNMENVDTPLQVVAMTSGISQMWEPYATLRYQHKPADFLVLHSDEHILTNPRERLISQNATVDWFRFWLQGVEDPSPSKLAQYRRWNLMREQERPSP